MSLGLAARTAPLLIALASGTRSRSAHQRGLASRPPVHGSGPLPSDALDRVRRQGHAAYVVAKKDALICCLKPPVISFGIVLLLFFHLRRRRSVPAVPRIIAIALFFTASAVVLLVTLWERQARIFERLVRLARSHP